MNFHENILNPAILNLKQGASLKSSLITTLMLFEYNFEKRKMVFWILYFKI